MSTGLTDADRERIETFCKRPPYDRSPEDLTPDREYTDDVRLANGDSGESLFAAVWKRFRLG